MIVDQQGLAFIAQREGCCRTAYQDAHRLAIGMGDNDPTLRPGDTITFDEACARFVKKAMLFSKGIVQVFAALELEQAHINVLTSLAWNYGVRGTARKSVFVTALRAYYDDQSDENLEAAGEQIAALPENRSRRRKEALIFTRRDYGDLSTLGFWDAGQNPHTTRAVQIPMPIFLTGAQHGG